MIRKKNNPGKENIANEQALLELLYRISREVATTLDLDILLEQLLSLAIKTIGAIRGSIIILDENGNPLESAIIVKEQLITHTNEQLRITLEEGLAGWVVKKRKPVRIPNTSKDKRWLRRPDDEETGAKSALSVPIKLQKNLVGVITLVHPEPDYLQTSHLNLIQAIADQAAVAVLNAQLYGESRRQARVMTALANSATAMASTLELEVVLNNILTEIQAALEVESVALSLIDLDEGHLEYKAAIHESMDLHAKLVGKKILIGQGFAGWVAEKGKGEIVANPSQDPRFLQTNKVYPEMSPHAIVAAPIFIPGRVLGVLEAINPHAGQFEPDALQVLSGIGSLAGSFIQNARLYEDLQDTHTRYYDLFENSIDPIIITDLEGNILESNHRTHLTSRYTEDQLRKMVISDIHEVKWDAIGSNFLSLEEDTSSSYESLLITSDNFEIPIQVNVHQIQMADDCMLQWIFRDITESKNLDQLREDLTSMIFHDLRSPLSNVISSLDVIQASLPGTDDPEIQSLFDIATRSTVRIQRLTRSLLDINRLESGQPITDTESIHPETLIQYVKQELSTQAKAKNQQVTLSVPKKIPEVVADRNMIERVLINLVQNAIKYTPTKGKIQIGVEKKKDEIHLWVLDSGPGVDPDYIDKIFDKYTRIHPDERIKGLGLGLAFCRLAVEGHGGRIWVENLPGGGAKFTFTLPLVG
jgi:PAS domain S-box-containing protein